MVPYNQVLLYYGIATIILDNKASAKEYRLLID